jgi:hypothetical protein
MHGPEALDRDILLIREQEALDRDTLRIPPLPGRLPEPHDVQHVGGGPPLLLPRCSAASAGSRPFAAAFSYMVAVALYSGSARCFALRNGPAKDAMADRDEGRDEP